MQVAILAGGKGTRMGELAAAKPKLLLSVAGRPFADHMLELLARAGVDRVALCIGHLGEQIRAYVADGANWGLEVVYVDEGDELRGTAGALRLASEQGVLAPEFGVIYGDSYLRFDLRRAWQRFAAADADMLMCVIRNADRWDRSNATVSGGKVTRYEKGLTDPLTEGLDHIDYGFSILARDRTLPLLETVQPLDLADLYSKLATRGRIEAFEVRERFYEIGSPAGLAELDELLSSSVPGGAR